MAKVSRPAQGANSLNPRPRPRAAYRPDAAPRVVSTGSVSKPKHVPNQFSGRTLVADATPKIVQI